MPPIWLISIIARTGLTGRLAKAASWVVMALVALMVVALLYAAFRHRDEKIAADAVTYDRLNITAEVQNKALEAIGNADTNQQAQATIDAKNRDELRDEVHTGDDSNAGPGVHSVLERMRKQQADGRR